MITGSCFECRDRDVTSSLWGWLLRKASLYALILIMAWGLKYHYSHAGSDDLLWILMPTAGIVSAISGMDFEREADAGYMSQDRRVLIAPACAGINFLIIAFSMASSYVVFHLDRFKMRLLWIGIIGVGAYGFTLVVNAIRIVLSIILFDAGISQGWLTVTRVHRLEGIVVYFIFLCLFFKVIRFAAGLMPGRFGQASKVRGLEESKKTPFHLLLRRTGSFQPGLIPLLWYVAVTLLVPVVNGAYRVDTTGFTEHAITVLTAGAILLVVFSGMKVCRDRLSGGFGFHHPHSDRAAQKTPALSAGVFTEQKGDSDERRG